MRRRLYWWFFIGLILSLSLIPCMVKAVDGDPVIDMQGAYNEIF